jgi:RNA exonuclease 1
MCAELQPPASSSNITNKMAPSEDDSLRERQSQSSSQSGSNGKKRKLEDIDDIDQMGMDQPPALPLQPDLPEFNLTSARRPSQDSGSQKDDDGWQKVERRPRKKAKKIPKAGSGNYPAIEYSTSSRLQSQIKISDLQGLVLYILTDATSPTFVSVRHRNEFRKVVVLMVPGLEMSTFQDKNKASVPSSRRYDKDYISPDDYYPTTLHSDKLQASVEQFADMFKYIWPAKTPGDDKFSKMHSPLHAMLTAPIPKTKEEKNWSKNRKGATPAKEPQGWKNSRTPIPEFILEMEDLLENEYVLHPAAYRDEVDKANYLKHRISTGVSQEHGWVDTLVNHFDDGTPPDNEIEAGSITAGRQVLAMDCEMCMTGEDEFSLTRVSLVGWDGSVILDELVKPAKPITNYLTQ